MVWLYIILGVVFVVIAALFVAVIRRLAQLSEKIVQQQLGWVTLGDYAKVLEERWAQTQDYASLTEKRYDATSSLFRFLLGPQEETVQTVVDTDGMKN